jgi:hypothetical protein
MDTVSLSGTMPNLPGMPDQIGAILEVASDLVGFLSAILLVIPTFRSAEARFLVVKRREEILHRAASQQRPLSPRILAKLQAAEDVAASLFRAEDRGLVVWGMRLLLLSFFLKLVYHVLGKWSMFLVLLNGFYR